MKRNKDINWEQVSMGIISSSGAAKSMAMESLVFAREGKYKKAEETVEAANIEVARASKMHFEIIQKEAQGIQLEFRVLFLHAEDQLLTTQTLILLVEEMIHMYKKIGKNNDKVSR